MTESLGSMDLVYDNFRDDILFGLADEVLGEVWSAIVDQVTSYGLAIKAGQKLGKLAAEAFLSTDEMLESYFTMSALYEFEDCLRTCVQKYESSYSSNKMYANALKFNQGFMLLAKTQIVGSKYSLEFLKIMNEKGLVNKCYLDLKKNNLTWMMGVTGAFKDFTQKNYDTKKDIIKLSVEVVTSLTDYITTCSYNDYVDEIAEYNDAVSTPIIIIEKEPVPINDKDLNNYINSLNEISQQFSNRIFAKTTTILTQDVNVYGDVYMSANVDLNGHTLNIGGNLYQTAGTLTINNGTLNVVGDYRIQAETINNIGEVEYQPVYAGLHMQKANDKVNIAGDFINRSKERTSDGHILSAGTLTIGGDVYDWVYDGRINATDTHKTILNGKKKQTVYFDNGGYFNILELRQPRSQYSITPDNCWKELIVSPAQSVELSVTQKSGQATLKWNSVKGATKYRIRRNTGKGWTTLATVSKTSYTDKTPANGTNKYIVVPYINGKFKTEFQSKAAKVTVRADTPVLSVKTQGKKVTVTWNAVKGASKYRIQRNDGKGWKTLQTSTKTKYVDNKVKAGKSYTYVVYPLFGKNVGSPSSAVKVKVVG